jgi:uncharacterized protein (DUF427 family)
LIPLERENAGNALAIEPFDGTVTVRFWDAVIASTDQAKVLRQAGKEPAFYVPFDRIYFDFLQKTDRREHVPDLGEIAFWRVSAMNRAAEDFMWALEAPDIPLLALAHHGSFDRKIARIEAVPAGGGAEGAVEM